MPELSVIIPCYNVKKEYLDECISSILAQTFPGFEVILVDDGSEEPYRTWLKQTEELDSRIRVCRQENQGVSAARNQGVSQAAGAYVCFVDADDHVLPDFFEQGLRIAKKRDLDILYSYVYRKKTEHDKKIRSILQGVKAVKANSAWVKKYTVGSYYKDGDKFFGRGPWARIIRADLARSHPFPIGVPIGEDVLWNLSVLQDIRRGAIADCIWYIYEQRAESVTCRYEPEIERRLAPFYERIVLYIQNEADRMNYLNRVFNDLRRYIFLVYLGNPGNKNALFSRWKEFERICRKRPWTEIRGYDYFQKASRKNQLKWLLLRCHLLFWGWTIKAKLDMLTGRASESGQ